MIHRHFVRSFAGAVAVAVFTTAGAAASDGLFQPAENWRGETVSPFELAVQRSEAVLVDLDGIRSTQLGGELIFNVFDGLHLVARVEEVITNGERVTLIGPVNGDHENTFLVVYDSETAIANVWTKDLGQYQLRPLREGVYSLQQINPMAYPVCGNDHSHSIGDEGVDGDGGPDPADIIDIAVFWTPNARNSAGGLSAIQNIVQGSINVSNSAYVNSQIAPRLRLVYSGETAQAESGNMGITLDRLRIPGDGWYEEVHGLRNQYGADVVSLLAADGTFCGIAYLMTSLTTAFAPWAFNVSNYSCAIGNITFHHEVGHNMGCDHDRQNGSGGVFSYSFGWRWTGNSSNLWATVMAYPPGTRVNYFSNPNVNFDGQLTGRANLDDNARSINNAALTVANFRQAVGDTGIESFTINFGQHISGGIAQLETSNNAYLRGRSSFGFTSAEPNVMQLQVHFETTEVVRNVLDLDIESRMSVPDGTARVRVRNVGTGAYTLVSTYPVGNTDALKQINGLSGSSYINPTTGEIIVRVRYSAVFVFSSAGFDAYVDLIAADVH